MRGKEMRCVARRIASLRAGSRPIGDFTPRRAIAAPPRRRLMRQRKFESLLLRDRDECTGRANRPTPLLAILLGRAS